MVIVSALPVFAVDIEPGADAQCVYDTLKSYIGPVTLNARWNPKDFNLMWFDDDDSVSQNSCSYDSNVSLPAIPTKHGFEFQGWRVRSRCNFSDFGNPGVVNYYGRGTDNGIKRCWQNSNLVGCNNFGLEKILSWQVLFGTDESTSIATGMSTCTEDSHGKDYKETLPGDELSEGRYNISGKTHCWCKITGYTYVDGNRCSVAPYSSWVYLGQEGTASNCSSNCAIDCARKMATDTAFRDVILGI